MPAPNHLRAALEAIQNTAAAGVAKINAAAESIDGSITKAAEAARKEFATAVSTAHRAVGAGHAVAVEDAAYRGRTLIEHAARQERAPTQDKEGTAINVATVRAALVQQDAAIATTFDAAEPGLRDPIVEMIRLRVGREGCTLEEAVFAGLVAGPHREQRKSYGQRYTEGVARAGSLRDRTMRAARRMEEDVARAETRAAGTEADAQAVRLMRTRGIQEED